MPRAEEIPGTPEEWLAYARSDLTFASLSVPAGVYYQLPCYLAQQAVEKALKGVHLQHGWGFRYVHDLEELITNLRNHGLAVPDDVAEAITLTTFAFEARYPGVQEPVTEDEYREALELATRVVRWAESQIMGNKT